MTKVCYYLEFSYIYKHLIINKKALCLIAEGCTSGVHIIKLINNNLRCFIIDNVIVIQNGRSFDITILPSERVFKWEIDVLGAHSIGKIHIYQNSTK